MKSILTIFLIFGFTFFTKGQILSERTDPIDHTLHSIGDKKLSMIDSVTTQINLLSNKPQAEINKYTDSTRILLAEQARLTSIIDSLKNRSLPLNQYATKLDSLSKLNSYQRYANKIDSLGTTNPGITDKIEQPLNKINTTQLKVQQAGNQSKNTIDEKLNVLNSEAKGQGNLPGSSNLPSTNLALEKYNLSKVGIPNPGLKTDTPTINADNPLNKLDIKSDVSKPLSGGVNLPNVDALQTETKEISKVTRQVSGYSEDVKNLKQGNIEKVDVLKEEALSKSPVKEELGMLEQQTSTIQENQIFAKSYKNPEEYKKQTLERGKQMAAQQMALFGKQIQESVNEVSDYQSKMGTVLSLKNDLPKRRDGLKKLQAYEKFVPGITLQIQKSGPWIVDINPSLRYRLTSYWSIGIGWNERLLFGTSSKSYQDVRIFGPRAFTEVVIFKGLSARLDAEEMSTYNKPVQQTGDIGRRVSVWSYMAGIRKEFTFISKVTGNVQFMCNLYSSNDKGPYPTRFNVRFGFEYGIKQKSKM